VVIEENEYGENDDGDDDEPLKHIGQQYQRAGDGQQEIPGNVDRG